VNPFAISGLAVRVIDPTALPKHFDAPAAARPREETFVVDTPSPTVSGLLHACHVFSCTHTDVIVRHQRMRGRNVFYSMGWDDNGLPTERRVQEFFHLRCDARAPYEPDLALEPETPAREDRPTHGAFHFGALWVSLMSQGKVKGTERDRAEGRVIW
jgi:hypothetical protein